AVAQDLALNEKRDRLCVGGSNGVQCFSLGENATFAAGQTLMQDKQVRSLEIHSGTLWVLEGDGTPYGSQLSSCVIANCKPQLVRGFGTGPAPSNIAWEHAMWAGLGGGRLIWV